MIFQETWLAGWLKNSADSRLSRKEHFSTTAAKARILLIHLASNDDARMCKDLGEALRNFFSLVCSFTGPCMLPCIGIIVTGESHTEFQGVVRVVTAVGLHDVILPLQCVRGNYARIHAALCRLREMTDWFDSSRIRRTPKVPTKDQLNSIQFGIQGAVDMFRRQIPALLQLEITLFSSDRSMSVCDIIDGVTSSLSLQGLKKIQLVRVKRLDSDDDSEIYSGESPRIDADTTGLFDIHYLDLHVLSMQSFLLSWLQDSSTDCEGLHLIFPLADIIVKCDVSERLLNVSYLPFRQNYLLCSGGVVPSRQLSTSSFQKNVRPVTHCQLEVIGRMRADAVCESLVFGNPVILRATSCWKIDWDELESNQRMLHSLCYYLNQQSLVLVARLLQEQTPETVPSSVSQPQGHFIILPSPNCSLLIKSLAVSELVLPFDIPALENPIQDNLNLLSDAISKIKYYETYNPLVINSGLFDSLHLQLMKSIPQHGRLRTVNQGNERANLRPVAALPMTSLQSGSAPKPSHKLTAREMYDVSAAFPTRL